MEKSVLKARARFEKKAGAKLLGAAFRGDDFELAGLLARGAGAMANCAAALLGAAIAKSTRCVELLLPNIGDDERARHAVRDALSEAAANGSEGIVSMILCAKKLQIEDGSIRSALAAASSLGRSRSVAALIPFANMDDRSFGLMRAAARGMVECVKELLPVANHSANDFEALRSAAKVERGGRECAELLLPLAAAMLPDVRAQEAINAAALGAAAKGLEGALGLALPFASQEGRLAAMVMAAQTGKHGALSLAIEAAGARSAGFEQAASKALSCAVFFDEVDCVKALAPVANCKASGSLALATAAAKGFDGCVAELLPWSDLFAGQDGSSPMDAAQAARESGHHHTAELIDSYREARELSEIGKTSGRRGVALRI